MLDMDAVIWLELLRLLFTVQMSTSFMSAAAAGPFQREPAVRRNLFMFAAQTGQLSGGAAWCAAWARHACLAISNLCGDSGDSDSGRNPEPFNRDRLLLTFTGSILNKMR